MNLNFDISPKSFWIDSTPQPTLPSLQEDLNVDVAIVGGGMVGITTAFLLKKAGYSVAVLESGSILKGTTGYTTAKITSQHNLIYDKLTKSLGQEKAWQYATANETAIKTISDIVTEHKIDCDFTRQNAYVFTQSDKYISQIEAETLRAVDLGIDATYANELQIPIQVKAAIQFNNQAQFHPRKYLLALANQVNEKLDTIYENTRCVDIKENSVITDTGKKVTAKYIVIASHFPFYEGLGMYFTRLHSERSYVVGVKTKEDFAGGMYINAEEPTRSLRYTDFDGQKLVLVGGENHKTGQSKDTSMHYSNLLDFAREFYTVEDVPFHWSTQDLLTLDDIPYVGNLTAKHENIFVATGFGKWGMTNSTAASMIISDLITKGENPWLDVYNPSRFTPTASAKTFISENLNVAANLFTGKIATLSKHSEIEKGHAVVLEGGGQKLGCYKDEEGILHVVDTTCTHMGCELNWNNAEKSWDCPCHGSRFNHKGVVIEGPAYKNLSYKGNKVE